MECQLEGKDGFKYGEEGECYVHDGSDEGKEAARAKAAKQGQAIEISKHVKGNAAFTLHFNNSEFGGKVYYKDDHITIIPATITQERVTNRALKQFDEFKDSAHWWANKPIIPPHKQGDPPVNHKTPKLGKILEAWADPERKTLESVIMLYNARIAPDDLKRVQAGEKFGNSPGYYCDDEQLSTPLKWNDGAEYDSIERGEYYPDHLSIVPSGACPLPHCGCNTDIFVDEDKINHILKGLKLNFKEFDNMTDKIEETPKADGPEIKANAEQKPEEPKVEAPKVNTEEPKKIEETPKEDPFLKINARFEALEASIKAKDAEIKTLKDAEALRQNEAKAASEALYLNKIFLRLNAAAQQDWETVHLPAIKTNFQQWVLDSSHLFKTQKSTDPITPSGQPFVPHVNAEDEPGKEFDSLIGSDEDLLKRVRGA